MHQTIMKISSILIFCTWKKLIIRKNDIIYAVDDCVTILILKECLKNCSKCYV